MSIYELHQHHGNDLSHIHGKYDVDFHWNHKINKLQSQNGSHQLTF